MGAPPGERGDDGQFIAVVERCGLALQVFDFHLVHVDVDVPGELATGIDHLGLEAGELRIEVAEDVAHGVAGCLHTGAVAHEMAEGSGDIDVYRHLAGHLV